MFSCLIAGQVLVTDPGSELVARALAPTEVLVWSDLGIPFRVFANGSTFDFAADGGAITLPPGEHVLVFDQRRVETPTKRAAIAGCHDPRPWKTAAVTFSTLMRFLLRSKDRYVWATVRGHTAIGLKYGIA
jgi:hypothetical protein